MANDEARFEVLLARCTAFGKDQLLSIRHHTMLPEVLASLEHIDGMIYASDIEHALFDAVRNKKSRE